MKKDYFLFTRIDVFIDTLLGREGIHRVVRWGQRFGVAAIVGLVLVCTAHFVAHPPEFPARTVHSDVTRIATILERIDRHCAIAQITPGLHPLTFLTMVQPTARDLCGIELVRSSAWTGPYLAKMPTLQSIPYQLLKTEQGAFVVPGNGVVLPSGKRVGSDIVWSPVTDMSSLRAVGGSMIYDNVSLVAQVAYGSNTPAGIVEEHERVQHLSDMLGEFAQSMSFAQADSKDASVA